MPKGYIIAHVTVTNAEAYAAYVARNNVLVPQYGGRYLVRGAAAETPETPQKARHVVIEFPDLAAAQAFYHSPEYQENLKIRLEHAESDSVIIEGYE